MNDPHMRVKIMLIGANGQVGWELNRSLLAHGEVFAFRSSALNLLDFERVRGAIRELRPDVIVNAAAYTMVDGAEKERELCMRLNAHAPAVLAEEAERLGACLVHYSSDYVFDGEKRVPWTERDRPNPINVYGESKLAGEDGIRTVASRFLIFRTSWVYASRGSNFLLTMLRLFDKEKSLRVVNDQIGAPTWARYISDATALAIRRVMENKGISGIYHLASSGQTSWCGFAEWIKNESARLSGRPLDVQVQPVATADYSSAAPRPLWSVLDTSKTRDVFGICAPDWESAARLCMAEIYGKENQ